MSEPFLAEIRIVGFNFAPRGWAFCDGQILPINQNQSLYSLLGTTYGGDGRTSFALPDIRSRTPIHEGSSGGGGTSYSLGQKGGEETHALSVAEIPQHTHTVNGSSNAADANEASGKVLSSVSQNIYNNVASSPLVALSSDNAASAGGGQGHQNMQPYLTLYYCIALQGLFPSRN